MPDRTRREFARLSLATAMAPLTALFSSRVQPADPFAGGTMIGTQPLFGRGAPVNPLGRLIGTGLDARRLTDLSTLTADDPVTPNERFYIRTSYPDLLNASEPWRLTVGGPSGRIVTLSVDDLAPDVIPMGTHLLECAGNNNPNDFGLMSAARWAGVPMTRVLARAPRAPGNARVLVSGFDGHSRASRSSIPGASWIFSVEELERSGAFLATEMNGVSLPRNHGFPLRLVVPRWYGCACIKWVNAIEYVADDVPATPHMREFAARTFQAGRPERARDYRPALMDHAAMPVRVEKWTAGGRVLYRVVGILWGGAEPSNALVIRFKPDEPFVRVHACPKPQSTTTWSLWWHAWRPAARGRYDIVLKIDEPGIRSSRLDLYYYARAVDIEEI